MSRLDEIRVLSFAMPGYGFQRSSFERGLKEHPNLLVSQGTSTDIGPDYLATGKPFVSDIMLKRDLELFLSAAIEKDITLITSLTGAGTNPELSRGLRLINEIAKEKKFKFTAAVIPSEIDKDWLKDRLKNGASTMKLAPHTDLPQPLTPEDVDRSTHIVAQMGPEPIVKALGSANVVITGRALDVGLIAALPLKYGFDPGLIFHMAKLLECGALSASPADGTDGLLGFLRKDHILVSPPNPLRKCTPLSVAAQSFYERANPFREENPSGYLDLSETKYEQFDERTVRVTGSRWVPMPYTIKLEGAALVGYRTISIGGIRCPILISRVDEITDGVKRSVGLHAHEKGIHGDEYTLKFRVYGRDGVMGPHESDKSSTCKELCILIDVVAKSRELADSILALARSTLTHWGFPGRISTAGNLGFPFSPTDISVGGVYVFNIFHTLALEDPYEPFPIEMVEFPMVG